MFRASATSSSVVTKAANILMRIIRPSSPPLVCAHTQTPDPAEGGRIMRIKMFAAFVTTLLLVALALNISAAAADQHSGTWKMNPAKSTYSPGPAPKSISVKIDSDADNIKLSSDGIDAAGNPTHVEYTAKYDGN